MTARFQLNPPSRDTTTVLLNHGSVLVAERTLFCFIIFLQRSEIYERPSLNPVATWTCHTKRYPCFICWGVPTVSDKGWQSLLLLVYSIFHWMIPPDYHFFRV
ncbi:hypothetical protein CEXT_700521 [Caerostris extrusa]|uniref:Uncharacterized protein n=1 Tax=Caerostris extrusa TaxID=172846 RepID=A0AAV4RZQ0_CAEEX|nr:hypothetical protein CEXT_700521 [Caerostris extrusa]